MLLPWGKRTVIDQVVTTFLQAGIEDILVVTGGAREQVENSLARLPVRIIHNPGYAAGEMLSSLQCGLRGLGETAAATLIALGDQPQIRDESIRAICQAYEKSRSSLVVPSFRMKRGHPWLAARSLWAEILGLEQSETLRDFLNRHASEIEYVNLDTPTVLADLDTPEDYRNFRP